MTTGMMTASYLGASALFILALGGLSHQTSARRGNLFGMLGMALAVSVTIWGSVTANYGLLLIGLVPGAVIGWLLAKRVEMTQMPELVAILHSLVGLAAVLVGFANAYGDHSFESLVAQRIHNVETAIGVFVGAVTFTGSLVAYLKLSGKAAGKPLILPARHVINVALVLVAIYLTVAFAQSSEHSGVWALWCITVIALIFGIHLVVAIGGADMPVVVSMLNSYSGWAAAAMGFMLGNDLLIVVGALVGSSGAILSYIMCRAMNRKFLSVILGGVGTPKAQAPVAQSGGQGTVVEVQADEVADALLAAKEVMIIPGYGMAVAQAQHPVYEITKKLREKGVNVRFGIHPVAGRMPGHMNVLLAEAKVPYDIVYEMDEINDDFPKVDVSVVIGANDIVNPSANESPDSPIAGMPVLEPWRGKQTVVLKRGMSRGYADVENPLFFKENTRMLFGDAKQSVDLILQRLSA
ncbi:MAG: NAD(P)(+) transhydrogenase (Re/Si-specific) subunit beta [Pontibacterium sp.]